MDVGWRGHDGHGFFLAAGNAGGGSSELRGAGDGAELRSGSAGRGGFFAGTSEPAALGRRVNRLCRGYAGFAEQVIGHFTGRAIVV